MTTEAQRAAITRAARERGENPAYALAVAERESSFNPKAHSSKTIHGMYQMRGDLRAKYGVGDSEDPYEQANGWMNSLPDLRREMKSVLGRDPTDEEVYAGHHFGARRAARMMKMDPSTPVESVFTPQEMQGNPHFARAGTVGRLNGSVMGDIGKRMARFGGENAPLPNTEPADLSSLGEPVDSVAGTGGAVATKAPAAPAASTDRGAVTAELPDLSSFGESVDQTAGPRTRVAGDGPVSTGPDYQARLERNKKWAKPGNYRTDLGEQEPVFQKWVQDNKAPFDVNRTGPDDYDMRGYWKTAQDPAAWKDLQSQGKIPSDMEPMSTKVNPNDGKPHYPDLWKTPYHETFSSESQWAQPNAPTWNDKDQLVDPSNGGVVYDEKAQPESQAEPALPDLSAFGTAVAA